MSDDLALLLSRTNLTIPFEQFLTEVAASYPQLGSVKQFQPITVGYEDANIVLVTPTGKFVVKIFLKKRSIENVRSYIRILEEAKKAGVPVIRLIEGAEGYLSFASGKITPYCITEFFEGTDFQKISPELADMLQVTRYLAKLNTFNFPVVEAYDTWGNRNFLAEFDKNKHKLSSEQSSLIVPITEEMRILDFSKFSTAIIHGDIQGIHVLKNFEGKYCILDFGCAANGPKVIEVSTFLAWFCFREETWGRRNDIFQAVVREYTTIHNLTQYEKNALPVLIRAAYAAYYQKTCLLINKGDTSQETAQWNKLSLRMLHLAVLAGAEVF